ncbi:MAG: diguanylate cyclase [Gemmataceae bacterium]
MERITETWVTVPKRPPTTLRDACLVHIYPTGTAMGARYELSLMPVVIGRGDDCEIQIQEHSVSRRHARIECDEDGYTVEDLKSTNGTFINDRPVTTAKLHDGEYLRVGNCIYRFLCGGNLESEYHEEIYRLTIIDGLTGSYNQRYMLEFVDRELARSARHLRPLALAMIDIDHFKRINDEYGHLGGDFALRELSSCVKQATRREDLFCRYGGEEFGLVLVETPLEQARQVAERIRATVAEHEFRFEGKSFSLSISMGLSFTCGDESMTVNHLIRSADDQLYRAKTSGRNQVCG